MNNLAVIGEPAPPIQVTGWVQGEPVDIDQLHGRVVLLEVFQVNCPGCFLYALPEAITLYERYSPEGLAVIGIATAFEDFDKNTLGNLRLLAESGAVVGETFRHLSSQGLLKEGILPYRIPFPLAMDRLVKRDKPVSESDIKQFINEHFPQFNGLKPIEQEVVSNKIRGYLEQRVFLPETFGLYGLKGTPSQILIDKMGVLAEVNFGLHPNLEGHIVALLSE